MAWPSNPLRIAPEDAIHTIIRFVQERYQTLGRKVAILGLSGGLDSSLAATLATKGLGAENVKLYYLPERDSNPLHRKHAQLMADELGAEFEVISIQPGLRALRTHDLLPLGLFPGFRLKARLVEFGQNKLVDLRTGELLEARLTGSSSSWIRRANAYISAKHRLRSVVLYKEAERLNGMVIGSANRTEWLTGTFTRFGCDHIADIMPLLHLYRSQLEVLAAHLRLPGEIRLKKADPDVLPGLNDKGSLLGSFEIADQILWGLENGLSGSELCERFGQERTSYLMALVHKSAHYRETPYSLL